MPDLNELPHHEQLEGRADPTRDHNEGIRREHEVVQAREEGLVLEVLVDERVGGLLERELYADPERLLPDPGHGLLRPLVRRLHEPRPAASDDVPTHL
jgi:hypothetical protein